MSAPRGEDREVLHDLLGRIPADGELEMAVMWECIVRLAERLLVLEIERSER